MIAPMNLRIHAETSSEEGRGEGDSSLKEFFRSFVSGYEVRDAGTQSESNAATYLSSYLGEIGQLRTFADYFGSGEDFFQRFEYVSGSLKSSQNVIAVYDCAESDRMVILGAHYDNYAARVTNQTGVSLTGSQGAVDNGSGVAVVAELIERITAQTYPFDIVFCFFGASEDGMRGADAFLSEIGQAKREKILLYLNFDSIGAGDNLYLYCDEFSTKHDVYLRSIAERIGIGLATNPLNKKSTLSGYQGFPYAHIGLMSDNVAFLSQGINSANFFSFAWGSPQSYLSESENKPSLSHTAKDNLVMLDELYKDEYLKTMERVVELVTAALADESFAASMEKSAQTKFDYRWMLSANLWAAFDVIMWIGLVIAVFCVYWGWKKKTPAQKPPEMIVFGDGLDG